jgi:hypothetical protein
MQVLVYNLSEIASRIQEQTPEAQPRSSGAGRDFRPDVLRDVAYEWIYLV